VHYHSLSHSAGVTSSQIRGLVQLLVDQDPRNSKIDFEQSADDDSLAGAVNKSSKFMAYEGVVPIERCELELDMSRAVIETMLTFLSMESNGGYLSMNTMAYATCTVTMCQPFTEVPFTVYFRCMCLAERIVH